MKNRIFLGDNLDVLPKLEEASINLIYAKPPSIKEDTIEEYLAYLEPRLSKAYEVLVENGTLYFHSDYQVVHYCKVHLLDPIFEDPNCFFNEIIWTYETDEEIKDRWVPKHDTILVYVKDPSDPVFEEENIDRISYLAPGLVGKDKERRGKLPTDVWWYTNLEGNGQEGSGGRGQLPFEIIKRIISASSKEKDTVMDIFGRDGKVGACCLELDRNFILIDKSRKALKSIAKRFRKEKSIEWHNFDPSPYQTNE